MTATTVTQQCTHRDRGRSRHRGRSRPSAGALYTLCLFACSGSGSGSGGATSDAGSALTFTVKSTRDAGSPYPWDPAKNDHWVKLTYQVTLRNNSATELQDLRVIFPVPAAMGSPTVSIEGGWYDTVIGAASRIIDWLPKEMGPIIFNVTFERNPNIFSESGLKGEVVFDAGAGLSQYDAPIASTASVIDRVYMPEKVNGQDFAQVYSGRVSGDYLYLSARPNSGPYAGRGGIYRLFIGDAGAGTVADAGADAGVDAGADAGAPFDAGGVEMIMQHTARPDRTLAFAVDGTRVYYVSDLDDAGTADALFVRDLATDSGATVVPTPATTLYVHAVAVDDAGVYAMVQLQASPWVIHRVAKNDFGADASTTPNLGVLMPDTIAMTSDSVFLLGNDSPVILRLTKDLASITPLISVGSTTGRGSLACSETKCFWTEWTNGWCFETPIPPRVDAGADAGADAGIVDAGAPVATAIASTNQPIIFDGTHIYSGINGLIRVGPGASPPAMRIFSTGVIPLYATDATYLYFGYDSRVWKLHK